jgi:hypothetical protein
MNNNNDLIRTDDDINVENGNYFNFAKIDNSQENGMGYKGLVGVSAATDDTNIKDALTDLR